MPIWLAVGMGGFAGALSRFWLSKWLNQWLFPGWPLGTFTVNVLGSFVLAALSVWTLRYQRALPPEAATGLGAGFLGSFTTMSTFMLEIQKMAQEGQSLKAWLYLLATIIACLGGAYLGRKFT